MNATAAGYIKTKEKCGGMTVFIVIPMYNEAAIIRDTVRCFAAFIRENSSAACEYRLILSDDGCTDGTVQTAEKAAADYGVELRVFSHQDGKNHGKGAAFRNAVLGLQGEARDIVIMTDADVAYGTDVIKVAVDCFENYRTLSAAADLSENDVIIGSRALHPDGYAAYTPLRRFASVVYVHFLAAFAGLKYSDSQCGFKAFRLGAAKKIFRYVKTDGFAFDFEALLIADKLRLNVSEMPVTVVNHRASKVHLFRDAFRMLKDVRLIKKRVRALDI